MFRSVITDARCAKFHGACVRVVDHFFGKAPADWDAGRTYYVLDRNRPEIVEPFVLEGYEAGPGGQFAAFPTLYHLGERYAVYTQRFGCDV